MGTGTMLDLRRTDLRSNVLENPYWITSAEIAPAADDKDAVLFSFPITKSVSPGYGYNLILLHMMAFEVITAFDGTAVIIVGVGSIATDDITTAGTVTDVDENEYFEDGDIAETVIGATIIAVGTSLPELAIAISAIKSKNYSLALGDVIGSLVTNLTLIFGITAMLGTIVIGEITHFLAMFLLFTNMIFLFLTSAMKCSKWQGMILLAMFFIYLFLVLNYQLFI